MASNIDIHVSSFAFINLMCTFVHNIKKGRKKKRQPATIRTRLSWRDYYQLNKDDFYLKRSIRMDISSFKKLLRAIKD
jgi:hypothetical protein